MVVLSPAQVDVSRADFHPVEQTQRVFRACIVRILAEPVAFRVLLTGLLHQVETFQASVPLQQVLDLVFRVLFGQAADEELAGAVVDLRGDDAHRHGVDDGNGSARLDLFVLVELGRASDPQHHVIVADTVKLDGGGRLFDAAKLEENELLLRVLARVDDGVAGVQHAPGLLQLLVEELFQVGLGHVGLHVAHVDTPCVERRPQIALESVWQTIAERQRIVLILNCLLIN